MTTLASSHHLVPTRTGPGTLRRPGQALQPQEPRALWRGGRLHRLILWWVRPLPKAGASSADAATRLEILARGGFPR